ncbi:Uma2 family endonuclease [Streptomyces sp. NPDC054834]
MSAAPVEYPERQPGNRAMTLLEAADVLVQRLPGYRVEIIGGQILVTPPPDGPHGEALTELMLPFVAAGLHSNESKLIQGIGVWLPDGPEDYAIPDFSVVDGDYREHVVENSSYDPSCFRLVLEVTSSNYRQDLRTKVTAYAQAKIPVYVIVDRKHQRVHVLTDPTGSEYKNHRPYAPGEIAALPDSIGAKVTLDVDQILKAGQKKAN